MNSISPSAFGSTLCRMVLLAVLWGGSPWASALVLAVNEGVTYQTSRDEMAARYAPLAIGLAKHLKQPVTIETVLDYASLRKGLAEKRFDIALVHPAHVSIQAIKQSNYRLLAVVRGYQNYQAQFLVRADAPYKSVADLKGLKIGAPETDSITAVMMRATLRDAGLAPGDTQITYTRYQEAVPFFVENFLTQTGVTASNNVVKAWTAKGGKVLAKSKPVPIKHIIASANVSSEVQAAVRDYLLGLDGSEDGKRQLEPTKYSGFDRFDQAELLKLGDWLGL